MLSLKSWNPLGRFPTVPGFIEVTVVPPEAVTVANVMVAPPDWTTTFVPVGVVVPPPVTWIEILFPAASYE